MLIRRYGEEAPLECARRTDAKLEAGDLDGKNVWMRIMDAAGELLNRDLEGETRH